MVISEAAQVKIGVRRSTRAKYDRAKKMTKLSMVQIADRAIDVFLENEAPKYPTAAF